MDSDFKSKVVYVLGSLVIAAACIYLMIEPLHTKTTTETRDYLNSPHPPGPFDEAMEESLKRLGG